MTISPSSYSLFKYLLNVRVRVSVFLYVLAHNMMVPSCRRRRRRRRLRRRRRPFLGCAREHRANTPACEHENNVGVCVCLCVRDSST